MKTKKRTILTCCATATLTLLLTAGCASNATQPMSATPADFVFTNGKVYTVDGAKPWADSVAVGGNRIVFVGDNAGAEALVGDGTEKIDLGCKQRLRQEYSMGGSRCSRHFNRFASNASKFPFPQLGFP